jgi:hypothetical protein
MGSAHSGCEGYEVAMGMSALGTVEPWLVQSHVCACAQALPLESWLMIDSAVRRCVTQNIRAATGSMAAQRVSLLLGSKVFGGVIRAPRRAAPQVVVAGKHEVAMRAVELDVSTIPLPNV